MQVLAKKFFGTTFQVVHSFKVLIIQNVAEALVQLSSSYCCYIASTIIEKKKKKLSEIKHEKKKT